MSGPKNRIIRHTGIYLLGDILRRSVSLIMLPIYTRYLSPEDYGVVELLSMIIDLATIIFGARIAQAIFRFYCTVESVDDKKSVIGSALLLAVLFNGIGTAVVIAFSDTLSLAVFSDLSYKNYIVLFSINMALLPLTEIPLTFVRARQKPWLYFFFSTLRLALQLALNIYLVVHLEMHVTGVIYSALISSAFMALVLIPYTLSKTGLRISKTICKTLISFSLPMKLAAIGSFYLTFGDRFILNIYTDLTQVGIYSLGYKFAFIFTILFWDTFEKMWDAEKYAIMKRPDAKIVYQKVFLYISVALIFFGLGMSLFTKDLLNIMSDPAFLDAYKVAPIVILAYIIQSWTRYCNFGILLANKTAHLAYSEIFASIIITVAYLTLIPAYGIYGAAWATVIGFTARFYWVNKRGKQLYDMELPWKKINLIATLAIFIYVPSLLIPDNMVVSIALRSLLIVTFIISLLVIPVLSTKEKNELVKIVGRIKSMPKIGVRSK